jgi:hypothetical protein
MYLIGMNELLLARFLQELFRKKKIADRKAKFGRIRAPKI